MRRTAVAAGVATAGRALIPGGKAVGNYGVTARCGGGNLGVLATIHVVA